MDTHPLPRSPVARPWDSWETAGLLAAIPGAVICTDLTGVIVYSNAAAEQLYGYPHDRLLGSDIRELFVPAEHRGEADTIMTQVVSGETWSGEFPVRTMDGSMITVRLTDSPLWADDGNVVAVIGVAELVPVLDAEATARRLAEGRVTRLAQVTAELAGCRTRDDVTAVVIAHAADAVQASVASLSLLSDEDTLALVGLRGGSGAPHQWATYSLRANLPTSQALRTGRTIALRGRSLIETTYPDLEGHVGDDRSMVCLPLAVAGRRLGVISLGFSELRSPDAKELQFLRVFADTCAQALERLGALDEAQAAAAKLGLLADVSIALAESLDYRATLTRVARLTVPTIADWCSVEIMEGGSLHTLAVEHTDPDKVALAYEYQLRYPADPASNTGSPNVARTGVSELYPEVTDEMLVSAARDDEHLRLTRELGLASVMIVPLQARGRVLGAITLISAESGRTYGPDDLRFAENLARRAAMAIDNAELFTQTQEVAVRLQHAVLPNTLPSVDNFDVAYHYSPAGRTEVGGDFYDVIVLPDGRIVGLLGDVAGRGVAAAAAMAQTRAAMRAYIAIDPDPIAVLTRLDALLGGLDTGQLVTAAYVLIDPLAHTLTMASAGHPPPIIIDADMVASPIWAPIGPPLGIGGQRLSLVHPMKAGTTLLLYSDGLIERRGENIDDGISRITGGANTLARGALQHQLTRLVASLAQAGDDDVTALALRRWSSPSPGSGCD